MSPSSSTCSLSGNQGPGTVFSCLNPHQGRFLRSQGTQFKLHAKELPEKEPARVSQACVVHEKQVVSDRRPPPEKRSPPELPNLCPSCPCTSLSPLHSDRWYGKLNRERRARTCRQKPHRNPTVGVKVSENAISHNCFRRPTAGLGAGTAISLLLQNTFWKYRTEKCTHLQKSAQLDEFSLTNHAHAPAPRSPLPHPKGKPLS